MLPAVRARALFQLLLLAAATLSRAVLDCGDFAHALKAPTLVLGLVGSGRSDIFHLVSGTGLCQPAPHFMKLRDHTAVAFDRSNLTWLAHDVAAAAGRVDYNVSELPLDLRLRLHTALCKFVRAEGVVSASASPNGWCMSSQDAIYLLPVLLDAFGPAMRVLLVTHNPHAHLHRERCSELEPLWQRAFFGPRFSAVAASHHSPEALFGRVWAEVHGGALRLLNASLPAENVHTLRFEDVASMRLLRERAATMTALLAWLGWPQPSARTVLLYLQPIVERAAVEFDGQTGDSVVKSALAQLGYASPATTRARPEFWPLVLQRELSPPAAQAFLAAISSGEVPRSRLELVVVRFHEDLSWAADFFPVMTLYNRGEPLEASVLGAGVQVMQANLGREAAAFLQHVVDRYDSLAEVTVFTHAGYPVTGFRTNDGGGHLQAGISFLDYVLAKDGLFIFSDAMSLQGASPRRETRLVGVHAQIPLPRFDGGGREQPPPGMCFNVSGGKLMRRTPCVLGGGGACGDEKVCDADGGGPLCSIGNFYDAYVSGTRPEGDLVFYSQGARFSVTAEQVRRRPRSEYERILRSVNGTVDPFASYLLETLWFYILVSPEEQPCEVPADAQTAWFDAVP